MADELKSSQPQLPLDGPASASAHGSATEFTRADALTGDGSRSSQDGSAAAQSAPALPPPPPPMTMTQMANAADPAHLGGMYKNWFLDYASYVILERAVPYVEDGLKPVQRRILHSLWELEDGRYNKVANVVGHTMKYHPHGDASINDAIVQLGQRELLIDTQGNWGNVHTGDSAAAPRYIEARLSKFALEVVFNPKTTLWQTSYDGRNKEPVTLPIKFPLLLAQGVEGIAVGLACRILPHNFNEIIDASIQVLRGKSFTILPDFLTGGTADFSEYNDGLRGGKVRVRANIEERGKNLLAITALPFGTTTTTLIDSIIAANAKEKIKVKKIEDNTAENVDILIHLPPGADVQKTINALYVFTDCETSLSPNACIIENEKPRFVGVSEILRLSTHATLALLKQELTIRLGELREAWHFASLEKIFIEKKVYTRIEKAETWEAVIQEISTGLAPYRKLFKREITQDDIVRLTEIKIKRISKFNSFKADEEITGIEEEMKLVASHLANLVNYAVDYFKNLKKKYGATRPRRTKVSSFSNIAASAVAMANKKLYVNRKEGFVGYGLRKDEYLLECSDLDDIIVFMKDGSMQVSKVAEKAFVGKDILHVAVFQKNDEDTVYNLVYEDGKSKLPHAKRFTVTGVVRDKLYDLTKGNKGSKVLFLQVGTAEESAPKVVALLKPNQETRKQSVDFNFGTLEIKDRDNKGGAICAFGVKKVDLA